MKLTAQVALVSEVPDVPMRELLKVSAALQKQVTRDLSDLWDIRATVDAFERLEHVEIGYWPILLNPFVPLDHPTPIKFARQRPEIRASEPVSP